MIDFELEPQVVNRLKMYHAVAEHIMRPISRDYDEHEHEQPCQFFESMWAASAAQRHAARRRQEKKSETAGSSPTASCATSTPSLTTEELCWGDAGLFLSIPNCGLGGAAVMAAGTPEQKERFLKRFSRRQAQVGRDGDHRTGMRFGLGRRDHHRDARRRSLGNQRHQNFLHRRRDRGARSPKDSSWYGRR